MPPLLPAYDLSELSTMTGPSWVALHGMVHSFIQLHKPFHYDKAVITLLTKVLIVETMVFPVVRYRCESWSIKKVSAEELMLLNCSVGEDPRESFEWQGDQTSQS